MQTLSSFTLTRQAKYYVTDVFISDTVRSLQLLDECSSARLTQPEIACAPAIVTRSVMDI